MTKPPHPFDALMDITTRPPAVFVRGEGSFLWDDSGKRYLDFVQGWAVNCLGHSPPCVADALAAQAKLLLTPSPAFYNAPSLKLANALVANSCFDQVFFANSGAEANEGAIKLARKYGTLHRNGAHEIITFVGGFHGRTLGHHVGVRQESLRAAVRTKSAGLPQGATERSRFRRATDQQQDRRRDAGADPGRSRRVARDRSIPASSCAR